jgi:PIN domain nuclease of toxin-antitoxin system
LTYLVDTNVLIWAAGRSKRLPPLISTILGDGDSRVLVSAATAWEIATKVRLGKLDDAVPLENGFIAWMNNAGYELIPIEVEVALRAGRLQGEHRDPFDRMLAAQALAMDIPILSSDAKLDVFGVRRLWS